MRMNPAARITSIVSALDELLDPGSFGDLAPNGLQVPGGEEARRVVTGVSAQRALIERAIELDAQLLLVHHGLFWDFHPTGLTSVLAGRLRPLFKHDVALAAYHIPLDAHPELGNNALLAGALGCERHEPFHEFRGRRIAIVSGSAADALYEAAELGLDAFLTGEPREHVMADARELGVHFIAAGHYATETFGVRALGDWLAGRFGIEHVFVDLPNPV